MNLNTLQGFRHEVYDCFERAADALFNSVDALLTETQAQSFPELSLSAYFERRWCSLYEAFEDGRIDQERLRQVFARYVLRPEVGERLWLGIDASSIERPESQTSPERTVVYKPNLPESSKPISYGWQFSTVVRLPVVALGYRRRYSHEHGYRFEKQALLWAVPRLRTPAPFERWSQVVAIVHNQLVLARPLVQAVLRPWETSQRPASPQQVRRAMPKIMAQLGTPARPPKPRGKSPGRPQGAPVRPAPRYGVVYKSKPSPKKRRKRA